MADKNDAKTAEIVKRQTLALDLRIAGFSYRAIGEKIKISHEQARKDVEHELQRLDKLSADKVAIHRQLELERLDKITKALDHWIESGNMGAINTVLKAMERRAKLLGLDAPVKQDVTSGGEKLTGLVVHLGDD